MYKEIHIGHLILVRLNEMNVSDERVCAFLNISDEEMKSMLEKKSLDSDVLLRWSKLLEYDFFRIYTQHLILYSPPRARLSQYNKDGTKNVKSKLPQFRKHIYTPEVIDFILEQWQTKQKTKKEIMDIYKIPKTTLYKWIEKYGK